MAGGTNATRRSWMDGLGIVGRPRRAPQPGSAPGKPYRPFGLVLAGGGARGAAHTGVLRALEHDGLRPAAIVGVSMGAIVGATYALNPDWYAALRMLDTSGLPGITRAENGRPRARLRALLASERAVRSLLLRHGAWAEAQESVKEILDDLVLGRSLEACHLPFAAVASDLLSGRRVVLRHGKASDAMYASAALAGVLPPLPHGDALLADGGYADMAPVDVARELGAEVVIVVDASPRHHAPPPRNGFQVLVRAMAISHQQHALRRYEQADLVIEPRFGFAIDTLDFRHQRHCIAAGVRATRSQRGRIADLIAIRRGYDVASGLRRLVPKQRPIAEGSPTPP